MIFHKYSRYFIFCFTFCFALIACNSGSKEEGSKARSQEAMSYTEDEGFKENGIIIERDLDLIKKDGILKAITVFSPTSYFLYKGQPLGFEYELLQRLAANLGLELQIVVADDMNLNKLLEMLNSGEGDILAYGLTVLEHRKKHVNFTHRHYESHQVLVQRKPENWRKMKIHEIEKELITNPLDLIGREVHVRNPSSYYQRLMNLQEEMGGEVIIQPIADDITTDEIIKKVVDGEIDFTIADNNIASINATYYHILDVNTAISFPQQIAWATRKNSPKLLQVVNSWIDMMKTQVDYNVIYNKYFKNKKLYKEHIKSEFSSETGENISEYDHIIKKYAEQIGWDWLLVSSLIYQESRFDPKSTSWAGGKGLMQLMPATAKELGVEKRSDPVQSVEGGTRYLQQIYERWDDIPDSVQRVKFTLASYNCGYHHVRDAQRLSEKNQAETTLWDDEVEEYLLKLTYPKYYQDEVVKYGYARGEEPYKYVREIIERYDQYSEFLSK